MKHRQLFTLGSVLVLVILLATACNSLASPKITITFSADETCTMEGATTIPSNKDVTLEVIGYLKEHDAVGIGIAKLDPGKTIKDLQDLPPDTDQPPWTLRVGFYEFLSDGIPHSIILNQADGPIYFLCFTPAAKIGALGPVEVK
ncbi:MAG: hypothetical protein WAV05_03860 [Anaerolineales bacterium]